MCKEQIKQGIQIDPSTEIHIILHPAEEKEIGYWVESPQIPGLLTQGDTIEECLEMIKDAYQCLKEPFFKGYRINKIIEVDQIRPNWNYKETNKANSNWGNTEHLMEKTIETAFIELQLATDVEEIDKEAIWYDNWNTYLKTIFNKSEHKENLSRISLRWNGLNSRISMETSPKILEEMLPAIKSIIKLANEEYFQMKARNNKQEAERDEIAENLQNKFKQIKF